MDRDGQLEDEHGKPTGQPQQQQTHRGRQLAAKLALPSLALAGGLSALELLRSRFQSNQLFLPDRYPNGIWDPSPYGLPAEDVWFRSDDGVELHGWWIRHPRPQGTVLFCHGNSGSIAQRVGLLRYMHRFKINLLAFDYRGYGRSAGKPSEEGVCRDARAAHDLLTGRLEQAPQTVILFGHSLGGAVAIDLACHRPVAGLVAQSTFTHVKDMARSIFPSLPIHLVTRNQFRSIEKVGDLTVPKLFIHGERDGVVPFRLGRELYQAAAEPKQFLAVPHADHNDVHRHGGVTYYWRLARFLKHTFKSARSAQSA